MPPIRESILEQLKKCPDSTLVNEIDFYVRRKKWVVNSTHQIIALYCLCAARENITRFLNQIEHADEILKGVLEEILTVYLHNEKNADEAETRRYVQEVGTRLMEFGGNVQSALSRLTSKEKLESFLEDFYRKVGEPVIVYMEKTNGRLFWIPFAFFKVAEIIAKRQYVGI